MKSSIRSSNFELLRIAAMFMIVLYHCLTECMMADPTNGGCFVAHCCCPNISCSDGIAEIS